VYASRAVGAGVGASRWSCLALAGFTWASTQVAGVQVSRVVGAGRWRWRWRKLQSYRLAGVCAGRGRWQALAQVAVVDVSRVVGVSCRLVQVHGRMWRLTGISGRERKIDSGAVIRVCWPSHRAACWLAFARAVGLLGFSALVVDVGVGRKSMMLAGVGWRLCVK
jgi:hypothetical protein